MQSWKRKGKQCHESPELRPRPCCGLEVAGQCLRMDIGLPQFYKIFVKLHVPHIFEKQKVRGNWVLLCVLVLQQLCDLETVIQPTSRFVSSVVK